MDKIWERILTILTGKGCGFELGYKPGISGDHTLLYISLVNPETINMLADRVGMKIRVTKGSDIRVGRGRVVPHAGPTLTSFGPN